MALRVDYKVGISIDIMHHFYREAESVVTKEADDKVTAVICHAGILSTTPDCLFCGHRVHTLRHMLQIHTHTHSNHRKRTTSTGNTNTKWKQESLSNAKV